MNELKIIDQREVLGKVFRIYGTFDNPLFLAKDVANWIEYDVSSINKMLNSVDPEEKVRSIVPTLSGDQEMWLLTEDGMYEVLFQSRKPIAKRFKKEVKQILKTIRKTGGYIPTTSQMSEQEIMAKAVQISMATIAQQKDAILALENRNAIQEQIIHEMQPKADYTDMILQSKSVVNINQIAKDYGMTAQEMNKILHEIGIQYKQGGQWLLYKKYHSNGYTHSETFNITHRDGTPDVVMNTKWTQKGRLFLYEKLKEYGYLPMIERGA